MVDFVAVVMRSCFRPAGARDAVLVPIRADVLAIILFLFRRSCCCRPRAARRCRFVNESDARLARAAAILRTQLLPALARDFKPEIYSVGDRLAPADLDHLAADAHQTDLAGALASVRERYRGERIAGIILLSDGADSGQQSAPGSTASGPPLFAIGLGSADGVRDREVVGLTAGDPRLDQSSVDLHVSAMSRGFGRTPFQLRGPRERPRPRNPACRRARRRRADR